MKPESRFSDSLASLLIDLVYLLLSPFLLLVLLIVSRGFTRPKMRRGLWRKLWRFPRRDGDRPCFWIHAVSVGEVGLAEPLIASLRERCPEWDIVLSVSTFTGHDVARVKFPDLTTFYFPLDLGFVVARALRRLRPSAVILLELEVWPNFLAVAKRRGIPVLVANGRMTERSCRRYARAGWLSRFVFGRVTAYGVQNEAYAERFRRLGVAPERIAVLGNLKYDRMPSAAAANPEAMRARLGWSREDGILLLVGGCTHPGEERILCELVERLRETEPGLRLVLAPRHVERLRGGEEAEWGSARSLVRWSRIRGTASLEDGIPDGGLGDATLLVDTVGELERFYSMADLVFVGGSLIPHGGHNMLEATRLGKPTCFGPHHHNFEEEAEHLLAGDGAIRVRDAAELEKRLDDLLREPSERADLGARGQELTERLGGAVTRHVTWLAAQLSLSLSGEN